MLKLIARAAAYLQAQLPVNRVVVLLTPIFAALSGWIASWVAANFPGLPPLTPAEITGAFALGATAAITAAYRWLKGWEAHEAQVATMGAHVAGEKRKAR